LDFLGKARILVVNLDRIKHGLARNNISRKSWNTAVQTGLTFVTGKKVKGQILAPTFLAPKFDQLPFCL
jgi:hypothetical protein